jgi:hypothetical protein
MHSEILVPGLAIDLDYALKDVPSEIVAIVSELARLRGRAVAEGFVVLVLAAVAGSAIAALGQERACHLLAAQLATAEEWDRGD